MLTNKYVIIFLLSFGLVTTANSQAYPPANYDPTVPKLVDVVGHDHGESISSASEIKSFMRALATHDPKRMQVNTYAKSWQGRDLVYGVISSEKNIQKLDEVKRQLQSLGNGDTLSEAELASLPAVVWLSYGVHGNEISPPDSSLFLAYHLLAAQNNELVDNILNNTIVIIDPSQNPDGRDRFVHHFKSNLGLTPLSDRYTSEHNEPWPWGRFNHYLFDLNRDWFAMTQPETQGKVAAVLEWNPVIYVDSHEMGGDSTYYFPPPAKPYNPNITQQQHKRQEQLGRNMASWFDEYGVPYFTREVFDAFYPGYGDMWPTLNGAIAMTFEQASARALAFERKDGSILTYAEGVRNNVLTSLATLQTVAENKSSFLESYGEYRSTAISESKKSKSRYFVLDLSARKYETEILARNLAAQGITVQRVPKGSKQCRNDYPNGAIVIDKAQPQGRLINTLMSQDTPLADEFIKAQEKRRADGLNHELYDVTAWSLPLMHGVSSKACNRVNLDDATVVSATDPIETNSFNKGKFGYAIAWTDGGQVRLVIDALKAGLSGKTTDTAFTYQGQSFPMGSVVFSHADNSENLFEQLTAIATKYGATVVPMQSSWVDDGPNFGSSSFAKLTMPKIAIVWGDGTSPTSAGNTRFVLERQLGLAVSPINTSTLSRANLSNYDVLIIPDTYGNPLARMGANPAVKAFVNDGGTLVAIESSISNLTSSTMGLLSTKLELATTDGKALTSEDASRVEGINFASMEEYENHVENHRKSPEDVPGVLVDTIVNKNHWLSSGYDNATALVTGRDIYQPLNAADGVNVFKFADADNMLKSGYLWEENRKQLAYKPFVMAQENGAGMVIAFTQSPTTRAYLDGLNVLLANAVVLAPSRVAQ